MHDTTRRWIGLVAAAITATTGLVATTTAPAQAITFYEGHSPDEYFTGNNGIKYRCTDDAQTVREAYLPGGGPLIAELRYSLRCRTAWARGKANYDVRVDGFYANGQYRTHADAGRNPGAPSTAVHWTVMLDDAGLLARACTAWGYNGEYEDYCTSRY